MEQVQLNFFVLSDYGFDTKPIDHIEQFGFTRSWVRGDLPTLCICEKTQMGAINPFAVTTTNMDILFEIKYQSDLENLISLATQYNNPTLLDELNYH